MVGLEAISASNAKVASFSPLVALFVGATQGIGQATLQHLTKHAPASSRIYTVARSASLAKHESEIAALRKVNPNITLTAIEADVSLIANVENIITAIKAKESKLDLLVLSAGFLAIDGLKVTSEGHDTALTVSYFSRIRIIQQLLPLLNAATAPRIFYVLAAGKEGKILEDDFGIQKPGNWHMWQSAVHSATLGTLALEQIARENKGLSIIHWYPGPVDTALLRRMRARGAGSSPASDWTMTHEESGERGLFYSTSDRYAAQEGGPVVKSGGGIYLLDPEGEAIDNEAVLADYRGRGVDEAVWKFTKGVFDDVLSKKA